MKKGLTSRFIAGFWCLCLLTGNSSARELNAVAGNKSIICPASSEVCASTSAVINAPVTLLPDLVYCNGTAAVSVPVKVSSFSNIGALSLTLHYDSLTLDYQSWNNASGFPGLIVNCPSPGTIIAGGYLSGGTQGYSLPDSSVLFILNFNIIGNFSGLEWFDDGSSCEYSGPPPYYPGLNDTPQSSFYTDGSITILEDPASPGYIAGPAGGSVCKGQTGVIFSVDPITNATVYNWMIPDGAEIVSGTNTNIITVDFNNDAVSGMVAVSGSNGCGTGDSSFTQVTVGSVPGNAGAISGPQAVCRGDETHAYSVVPVTNATGYTWTVPAGATLVSGFNTNAITVKFGSQASSGEVMVYAFNECGNGAAAPPLNVVVNEPPVILTEPVSTPEIVAGNGLAVFTLAASGTGLTYHWQEYDSSWNDLTDGSFYSGVTTDSLRISDPPLEMDGYRYRCRVSGECLPEAVSDGTAVLNVSETVGISEMTGTRIFECTAFPNPFVDHLFLSCHFSVPGRLTMQLFSSAGTEMKSCSRIFKASDTQVFDWDVSFLAAGMYLLKLEFTSGNISITDTRLLFHNP